MKTGIVFLVPVICSIVIASGHAYKGRRPSIEIRPEIYLGIDALEETPRRLPWPLEITITAVDDSGKTLAGPLSVITSESIVGAEFRRAASLDKPPDHSVMRDGKTSDAGDSTAEAGQRVFSTPPDISAVLEHLEFAAYVEHRGAYSIYVKGFVRLRITTDKSSEVYSAVTTRECRPGKELVFAKMPDVTLKIKVRWLD